MKVCMYRGIGFEDVYENMEEWSIKKWDMEE